MRKQHFLLFFLLLTISDLSFAGTVVKSKGKKVYIVFDKSEGGTFQKDDLFNITDANGKKIGIVELKKIKGYKAIGVLKKGKASKGSGTQFRSISKKTKMKPLEGGGKSSTAQLDTDDEYDKTPDGSMRWGLQVGYGSASQDVVQTTGTSSQSGSSMAFKGIMDYPLLSSISLHGGLGAEMFTVSGTGTNVSGQTNQTLETKITYLSIDTLLKWVAFGGSSFKFYLLGGAGILHPLSKTSDAIDSGTISSLAIGEFGAGAEIKMGGLSIPLDVTYYYFPKGETVTTSIISVKIGMFF